MTIEVTNIRICSVKANGLRYIYTIRGTQRDITIEERKVYTIKTKNHPMYHIFFVEPVNISFMIY